MTRRKCGRLLAAAVLIAAVEIACSSEDRQVTVAERGSEVMPFDLDRTTHRFTPNSKGLVEEVVADDPGDAKQIRLIREHLTREADRFAAGDFGDPAEVHGRKMPGLAELEAGAENIEIRYREVSDGARITFATSEPDLVTALDRWGAAQVDDHGEHAE